LKFRDEEEMRKYGIGIDPLDPNRVVPLSQLVHSQDIAADTVAENRVGQGVAHQETAVLSTGSDGSFARETCGAAENVAAWDDQSIMRGMKAECAEIRSIEAHFPGRYHRLGTLIIESNRRFGDAVVRQTLLAEGISRTKAHWAMEIARLYTYEQAVGFPSVRAIVKTLPPKQPRKPNPKATAANNQRQEPAHSPPEIATQPDLDEFIRLGVLVRERFGDEALDQAVEQIKAHARESFEESFVEV
jgi:hypothetical protein